ncbi:14709_t:CDS:1, partial [Dentiscutata heterogama]
PLVHIRGNKKISVQVKSVSKEKLKAQISNKDIQKLLMRMISIIFLNTRQERQ